MASSPRSKLKGRRPSRPPKARVRSGSGPERPAPMHKSHAAAAVVPTPAALVHELGSCVTEADIAQVLYRGLHPLFGYDVVNLHVLEREGWYHSLSMDSGVLQDLRRRPLSGSVFVKQYANPRTVVIPLDPKRQEISKGPGAGRETKFAIWVPIEHQGEVIGSVIYQGYRSRRVPPTETAFLDEVHRRLGVLLTNASLNQLLQVDVLHMAARDPEQPDKVRLLNGEADAEPTTRCVAMKSAPGAAL